MSGRQILMAINKDKKLRTIFGGIIIDGAILMSIIVMAGILYL
jgi:hypothetical protein